MLSNKTAIVTGGAGDLGNEMAFKLGTQDANIVIWDILSRENAESRIQRVAETGANVLYQQVDVADRDAVEKALEQAIREFGQIDIACVNAGIVEAVPFLEISQDNWQKHIDVNLTGAFNVAQSVARHMVTEKTEGRIIFTTSWVGEIPWPEITSYTVTKSGLNMLMKQMARELAQYGVRVNAVAPGIVEAGLAGRQLREEPQYAARVAKVIPLGNPGTPVEIAEAVAFLASPQTAYMTGSILTIDGGCSLFQFDS